MLLLSAWVEVVVHWRQFHKDFSCLWWCPNKETFCFKYIHSVFSGCGEQKEFLVTLMWHHGRKMSVICCFKMSNWQKMLKITQWFNSRRITRLDPRLEAILLTLWYSSTSSKSFLVAEIFIILGEPWIWTNSSKSHDTSVLEQFLRIPCTIRSCREKS